MKLRRTFVYAAVTAACLTTAVLRAQTPQAPPPPEGFPAFGSPAVVKIIDAGAQPRKALRYAVPNGYKGRMQMTMSLGINMNMGGMSMPMNLPGLTMTADVGVTSVAANGDMTYSLAFSGVSVDAAGGETNPMLASALGPIQQAITGIKGTATVTARGLVKDAKIDAGENSQAQQMLGELTSQLENLATAFPEEAVGVGAKWESRQSVKTAGQYMFQKSITEITAINGNVITLKSTTEQTVPAQSFSNPALPADAQVQLEGAKGTGTGTMEVHLDTLVPKGESNVTSSMSMSISMGGQTQQMQMENTIKLTIAPAPIK